MESAISTRDSFKKAISLKCHGNRNKNLMTLLKKWFWWWITHELENVRTKKCCHNMFLWKSFAKEMLKAFLIASFFVCTAFTLWYFTKNFLWKVWIHSIKVIFYPFTSKDDIHLKILKHLKCKHESRWCSIIFPFVVWIAKKNADNRT